MVAEVLDAEESTASASGEQLYVHAPNPVNIQPSSVPSLLSNFKNGLDASSLST